MKVNETDKIEKTAILELKTVTKLLIA